MAHPERQREKPAVVGFHDALGLQPRQGLPMQTVSPFGNPPHPELAGLGLRPLGNLGKNGVENGVVQRRGIGQVQSIRVGIYAALQG